MLTDEQKETILREAYDVLERTAGLEDEIAERRERIARGEVREWTLPPQEPPPRAKAASKRSATMTHDERAEVFAWVNMCVKDAVRSALAAQKIAMADALGRVIAEERSAHRAFVTRMIEQRAAPADDATVVLDLRDFRRNGTA